MLLMQAGWPSKIIQYKIVLEVFQKYQSIELTQMAWHPWVNISKHVTYICQYEYCFNVDISLLLYGIL